MASSVFIIFLSIFLSSISQSHSKFLILPLTHSLSTAQFNSTHHLLKSTSTSSTARFLRHRKPPPKNTTNRRQISLPLSPGTDYTLSFSIGGGSNTQTISLYMDTGSDIVWLPCNPFECILCENKYNPKTIPNPSPLNLSSSAKPTSCKSPACSTAHSSLSPSSSSDLCAAARCPLEQIEISDCAGFSCPPFYYAYADGSLIAKLYTDSLSIPTSSPSPSVLVIQNFTFGCAHSALAEPIGVAGFGRGVLSLPAQLASFSPQLGNQFSYCLVSHEFEPNRVRRPSPLILGRYQKQLGESNPPEAEFVYTPMLDNPKHPYFYSVGLEAVSVGKRRITAPESLKRVDTGGDGGMVVDSGTTFTILPSELYDSVVSEFTRGVGNVHRRASRIEEKTGLSPCYYLDDDSAANKVPAMVFHFLGNSSVVLPRRNYFYEFFDGGDGGKRRKVGCVMVINGGDYDDFGGGGPVGTLGNYQQQGFEVVYDLEGRRVGFARRKCASLWDNSNQR